MTGTNILSKISLTKRKEASTPAADAPSVILCPSPPGTLVPNPNDHQNQDLEPISYAHQVSQVVRTSPHCFLDFDEPSPAGASVGALQPFVVGAVEAAFGEEKALPTNMARLKEYPNHLDLVFAESVTAVSPLAVLVLALSDAHTVKEIADALASNLTRKLNHVYIPHVLCGLHASLKSLPENLAKDTINMIEAEFEAIKCACSRRVAASTGINPVLDARLVSICETIVSSARAAATAAATAAAATPAARALSRATLCRPID